MADQIQFPYFKTGATLYAHVRKQDATIWNGSAFEAYSTANIANYDLPMTEEGTASQHYKVAFPAGITTEAPYEVMVFEQAGGSPAEGDTIAGKGTIHWNGTMIVVSALTAAEVWTYTPRTLTQSAASVNAVVAGSVITVTRGDSLSIALTGLGSIVGNTEVWFSVKELDKDADATATLIISDTGDLETLNGDSTVTSTDGTLTVDDDSAGDITVTLKAVQSAKLVPGNYKYDVQWKDGSGDIFTLTINTFTVTADVTHATS